MDNLSTKDLIEALNELDKTVSSRIEDKQKLRAQVITLMREAISKIEKAKTISRNQLHDDRDLFIIQLLNLDKRLLKSLYLQLEKYFNEKD